MQNRYSDMAHFWLTPIAQKVPPERLHAGAERRFDFFCSASSEPEAQEV